MQRAGTAPVGIRLLFYPGQGLAGLIKPSVIKPVITTIEASLVIRRLGQLKKAEQEALRKAINHIVGMGNGNRGASPINPI